MVYMSAWNIGHTLILFLSMITGILSLPYQWTILDNEVSYNELIKFNVTCLKLHNCHIRNSSVDSLRHFNCHCGPACMQLGTCCMDSKYRTTQAYYDTSGVNCRVLNRDSFFEIKGCPTNWDGEDFVKDLCLGNAKALNDPLLLVPVSSSRTGITYRNYFCFVCNVDVDADWPVFWIIELTSLSENVSGYSLPDLSYNEQILSWTVRGTNNSVAIDFKMPYELQSLVKWCHAEYTTIKTCAENWTDGITKEMCEAYMAEVTIPNKNLESWTPSKFYQNPHCAACNFVDVSDINKYCLMRPGYVNIDSHISWGISGVPFVGLFSLENKTIRCPRNTILDAFKNKCRAFRCGKGKVNMDGKCEIKRF